MRSVILLLIFLPILSNAQTKLHANVFVGFGNYYGDLQNKPITLDQSNLALGLGVKYDITDHFAVRTGFTYGKIAGDDKRNKASLQFRNLNFESKIFEFDLLGEYTVFNMYENKISPYVFAGVAMFHFNPYTYDTLGNKYFLKPLSTEGQGLSQYPDRKPYKLTQFSVPFGAGVKFRVTENVILGYEIGLRKTFTDYLDDVSKTYVSDIALNLARGATAVDLSYRGDELKDGDPVYPQEGTVRGGEDFKDWYYFSGFTLSIGINTGNGLFGGNRPFNRRGKSRIDCPVRVQ